MIIRNIRKSDYSDVDALLLQIHQVDVVGRPDMFSTIDRFMTRDAFDSLVGNKEIISNLAQDKGAIIGCCFVSMMERNGSYEVGIC